MTIFLAGHDTTAAALCWMCLHRDAESQLQAELSSVLEGRFLRMISSTFPTPR